MVVNTPGGRGDDFGFQSYFHSPPVGNPLADVERAFEADEYVDRMAKAIRRGDVSYPDEVAQSHKVPEDVCRQLDLFCPTGVAIGECEAEGHHFGKEVICNREWCSHPRGCGGNNGKAHQRRKAAWMPRARQMSSIGQWTIPLPPEVRDQYRSRESLGKLGQAFKRSFQRLGFERGLRRCHFFGEEENAPVGESPVYHPHFNILTESAALPYARILAVKQSVARILKVPLERVVVHYQYDRRVPNMLHMLKYVLRPTFLDWQWDEDMAYELIGFRNALSWGHWDGPALWDVPPAEDEVSAAVERLEHGRCAVDGSPVTWGGFLRVSNLHLDVRWGYLDAGYWQFNSWTWRGPGGPGPPGQEGRIST